MTTKHTPGPWTTDQVEMAVYATKADGSYVRVADTYSEVDELTDEELEQALRGCADALGLASQSFRANNPGAAVPNLYDLHIEAARAALAKAGRRVGWWDGQDID